MYGTWRETSEGYELQYERHLPNSAAQVWAALTEPAQLARWLAAPTLELRPGGKVELRWLNTDPEGNTAVARGTVTALEPLRLLEFDTDIHGRLRWELRPAEGGCRLTFTVLFRGPREYLERILAGWHIHLDHLAGALRGETVDWPNWYAVHLPKWQEYHDQYVARLKGGK